MSSAAACQTVQEHPEHSVRGAVDVLICGSGSAGLACALWLAIYNDRFCKQYQKVTGNDSEPSVTESTLQPISYRIIESRDGPLKLGQADGVQCRTVEIFESFGLDHYLLDEGYWVNEVSFWAAENNADHGNGGDQKSMRRAIVRTGRTADVQPGLSHLPHLILNQARINGLMLQKMESLSGRDVEYDCKVISADIVNDADPEHPARVVYEKDGIQRTCRARYVLAGDGAHSQIRRSLQIPMEGDSSDAVWGVMDVFPQTNFPDFRKKTTIHADIGTILIVPREGDIMIRLYLELPKGTNPKSVKLEDLQKTAKSIFFPYNIDFLETKWWSAYSIGQRVAKHMADQSDRIFLSGDSAHTHSPKAGQGMNASLQDGYNIGWKLGAVLTGQADKIILQTYVQERHQYAKQLIEFDRYFAKLFSSAGRKDGKKERSEEFNQAFIKAGVFTAGMAADYRDSPLVNAKISRQSLAPKIIPGQRLPSAQIVRMSDSKVFPLLKLLQSDGRWRIIVFPGNIDGNAMSRLDRVGEYLVSKEGILAQYTPAGKESDDLIETLVVLHGDRSKIEMNQIHPAFKPELHEYAITNLHKIFFDDNSWNNGHGEAYRNLGIDPVEGCIVVARPDQYVSTVLHLDDVEQLSSLFARFLRSTKQQIPAR